MTKPTFSVITTAKNEKSRRMFKGTSENWNLAKQLFEERTGKRVEFIFVDAGGNAELPEVKDLTIIDKKSYKKHKLELYRHKRIRDPEWDSPAIGRNLGTLYANGEIITYQDIDSNFSTGTEYDRKFITELDEYENYFEVVDNAFRKKNIVGVAPSLRPRDGKSLGRRFGCMGMNFLALFSTKLPSLKLKSIVIGPSIPGCSFSVRRDVALKLCYSFNGLQIGPYDPELAIAEDHKFSRSVAKYGRVSYEKKAGVFIRSLNRVSGSFDLLKSLGYSIEWLPYYLFPDRWKYKKHSLSI